MSTGRDSSKAHIRNMLRRVREDIGEPILIKRITGASPGDPVKGISPSYTFSTTPSRAIIESLTQDDILYSGGLYQIGDLNVQLDERLQEITDKGRGIGDRMIWRESEYQVVGKKKPQHVVGKDYFFLYVMRKVKT